MVAKFASVKNFLHIRAYQKTRQAIGAWRVLLLAKNYEYVREIKR